MKNQFKSQILNYAFANILPNSEIFRKARNITSVIILFLFMHILVTPCNFYIALERNQSTSMLKLNCFMHQVNVFMATFYIYPTFCDHSCLLYSLGTRLHHSRVENASSASKIASAFYTGRQKSLFSPFLCRFY